MNEPIRVLLISGSTRPGSTNTAALRALAALAPTPVSALMYDGLSDLPAFNPDDDGSGNAAVVELRRALGEADAVLFSTPEYAGTLPGSLKNLLDWTVGGADLYGKPVASVNVAHPGRGDGAAATLGIVLGYVAAVPIEGASVRLAVPRELVGTDGNPDGLVSDETFRAGAETIFAAISATVLTAPSNG